MVTYLLPGHKHRNRVKMRAVYMLQLGGEGNGFAFGEEMIGETNLKRSFEKQLQATTIPTELRSSKFIMIINK